MTVKKKKCCVKITVRRWLLVFSSQSCGGGRQHPAVRGPLCGRSRHYHHRHPGHRAAATEECAGPGRLWHGQRTRYCFSPQSFNLGKKLTRCLWYSDRDMVTIIFRYQSKYHREEELLCCLSALLQTERGWDGDGLISLGHRTLLCSTQKDYTSFAHVSTYSRHVTNVGILQQQKLGEW